MREPESGATAPQTGTEAGPLQAASRQQLERLQDELPDTVSQHPDGQRWTAQEDGEQTIVGHDNNETQVEAARASLRAATMRDIPRPQDGAPEVVGRPVQTVTASAPDLNPRQVADASSRFNEPNERLANQDDIDAAYRQPLMQRVLGRVFGTRGRHRRK
jgi:hypothetical protein